MKYTIFFLSNEKIFLIVNHTWCLGERVWKEDGTSSRVEAQSGSSDRVLTSFPVPTPSVLRTSFLVPTYFILQFVRCLYQIGFVCLFVLGGKGKIKLVRLCVSL